MAGARARVCLKSQFHLESWQAKRTRHAARSSLAQSLGWRRPTISVQKEAPPPAAVHAMIVEVDPETMQIHIQKYLVVHDCGKVINPLILDGQIHGGVAQGIGNAFYERLAYDENGQLLNGTFMDYHLPTSLDVPRIETGHGETLSPLNPMGVKGAGEAGAIPVGPLFAQALEDALHDVDFEILEIPLNSNRLWEIVSGK